MISGWLENDHLITSQDKNLPDDWVWFENEFRITSYAEIVPDDFEMI